MKKTMCLLLCALMLCCCAGCKTKAPRDISGEKYQAMASAALTLTETYNDVARTAIENGWEADFEVRKIMNRIASQSEEIIMAVNDPAEVDDAKRDHYASLAQELTTELTEEILPKVSEPCPKGE